MASPRVFIAIPMIGHIHPTAYISHLSLSKPVGTAIACVPRAMPDEARNRLTEQALKFKYDYLFYLDDDMVVPSDLLKRLLEAMESEENACVGILSPFAYKRVPPYTPCVFRKRGDGKYDPVDERGSGVINVDATTVSATLVRAKAIEKIAPPWFEFRNRGEIRVSEDITFCEKMIEAGYLVAVDSGIEALHISEPILVGHQVYDTFRQAHSRIVQPDRRIIEG